MIQFDEHIFQMGWFNHQPVFVDVNLFNNFKFQSDLKQLNFWYDDIWHVFIPWSTSKPGVVFGLE